ncbi:MAG TPA: peptidoglycan-binding protein [Gallicola sp.]|nr:peptidoglycan-binding protein [Gallicola sp.]
MNNKFLPILIGAGALVAGIFYKKSKANGSQTGNNNNGSSTGNVNNGSTAPKVHLTRNMLKMGDRGEDVRKLQLALMFLGFDLRTYGADGIYGSETESAVRSFQKKHTLVVDGIAGPETLGKINSELYKYGGYLTFPTF